jgi:HD domain
MKRSPSLGEGLDGSAVTTVDPQVFTLVTAAYLLENRSRLESSHVPLYRVTAKTETRFQVVAVTMPQIEALPEGLQKLQEYSIPRQWTDEPPAKSPWLDTTQEDAFLVRWNELMEMPPAQRVKELSRGRQDFEGKILSTPAPSERARLVVNIADQALVKETVSIVQSVVTLVEESDLAVTLFQSLQSLTNGNTLNHIVRVFSNMVTFLVYYNDLHAKGLNQKVRLIFPTCYKEEYQRYLPGLRDSLATSDNMVRLPNLSVTKVRTWALGALMHDIGKILDLGYFENEAAFDATRIKQHPIIGSGLFQRTYGEKFEEARYIVGDHHNYMFHPDGYGLSRWERSRSPRAHPEIVCCVADALENFTSGQALSFLPVEICTIIDVYDALTDPSRQYKKPMTPQQTIAFMEEHFRSFRSVHRLPQENGRRAS